MKKIGLMILILLFTPLSHALDAKGTIDEIKICGTGATTPNNWVRTLQFKVDGKWFGTYADFNAGSGDYDNNISTSLILMAYSQNNAIEIRATGEWVNIFRSCGISQGGTFNAIPGDYIKLAR